MHFLMPTSRSVCFLSSASERDYSSNSKAFGWPRGRSPGAEGAIIRRAIHGDGFMFLGWRQDMGEVASFLRRRYELKVRGILGREKAGGGESAAISPRARWPGSGRWSQPRTALFDGSARDALGQAIRAAESGCIGGRMFPVWDCLWRMRLSSSKVLQRRPGVAPFFITGPPLDFTVFYFCMLQFDVPDGKQPCCSTYVER